MVELLLGSRQPSFGGLIARDGYFWPDTPMVIDRPMKRWREYGLPFFAVRLPGIARLLRGVLRDTDNVSDAAVMTGAEDHPAYGSAWRQRDFEIVTGAEFRKF